jgi:acyl CoA:acetate/3-ketoacid CoA transferase
MTFDSLIFRPGARVRLPDGLKPPFEVFVNGIEQQRGVDYVVKGDSLFFRAVLVREGRLGFWRWLSMFIGIINTYRANDGVDVAFRANGRPQILTALPIETLGDPRTDFGQHGPVSFDPARR